jgi:putative flippase GtrA
VTPGSIKQIAFVRSEDILQFIAYVAVSGGALCVDVAIYWLLLKVAYFAFLAAAGGYVFGVMTHYILSSRIVFRSRFSKRGVIEEAPTIAKFFAAGASGLVVTAAVVGLLADVLGFHPLFAKFVAAGCSFVVVFLSMRFFVFNQSGPMTARTV